MAKPGHLVINLGPEATEALTALAEFTGARPETMAKRILSGVLTAIAVSMETESDRELEAGSIFPGHRAGAKQPGLWPPTTGKPPYGPDD